MENETTANISKIDNNSGLSARGLYEVFINPSGFFNKLKDNPKVLIPLIVYAVIILSFLVIVSDHIVQMQMDSPQMQEKLQGQQMSSEMAVWMKYSVIFLGLAATLFTPLLAAVFALFFGNFVFAGKATFKQLFSVMIYGELIIALGRLVVLPMVFAKDSILVSFSLGVLAADAGPQSLFYVALSKVDLFIIWELIVIGIGLSLIYNISRNKGYLLSVLSMGLLSILHIIFAAVML